MRYLVGLLLLSVPFLAVTAINQNTGVEKVCVYQDQLFTYEFRDETGSGDWVSQTVKNFYITATSEDGGLTWQTVNAAGSREQLDATSRSNCPLTDRQLVDARNTSIHYRWRSGVSIQRSKDHGRTWDIIYDLSALGQEVRKHYQLRTIGFPAFEMVERWSANGAAKFQVIDVQFLPISAMIDYRSGNIIFAMGRSGVLVLTPDNQWHWASVGNYRFEPITWERTLEAIRWEFWMAVALVALIVIYGWFYAEDYIGDLRIHTGILIGSLYCVLFVFVFIPNHHFNNYLLIDGTPILPGVFVVIILPLLFIALKNLIIEYRFYLLPILLLAFGAGACFLFPYFEWGTGDMVIYRTAQVQSAAVSGAFIVLGGTLLIRLINWRKQVTRDQSPFYEENEG